MKPEKLLAKLKRNEEKLLETKNNTTRVMLYGWVQSTRKELRMEPFPYKLVTVEEERKVDLKVECGKQMEFDNASALLDVFFQQMEIPMTTTLWINKYEPKTLDEMVLNNRTRAKLINVMRDCPHVILYGLPGCGKTTFCNVFFKKTNHIYISGKSGVAVIRDKVKQFAMAGNLDTFFETSSPQPSIKYVIINEADWLGEDAQAELRMIIEDYSHITRFALITNEIDKLQDQIRSRCREVEFEKADHKEVVEFVRKILVAEGVSAISVDQHVGARVNQVWQHSPGDIRRVIDYIQSIVVDGKLDMV